MSEDVKENPFKQPKLIITERDKLIIGDAEGKRVDPNKRTTPSYKKRDTEHPERLPQQQPPNNVNRN
jgi:hypothetical protein